MPFVAYQVTYQVIQTVKTCKPPTCTRNKKAGSDVGTMDDMKKMLNMLYKQVKSTNRQLKALRQQQQQSGYVVEMTAVTYTVYIRPVLLTRGRAATSGL